MTELTGAEALVEALKEEGVEHIFGIPGGAMIDVYDVLYDEEGIDHILTRHEQGAAHAADAYARVTGKPGVCMATSGPGATNLTTGITNAYMDSSPVIAITGQVPKRLLGTDAFQEADMLSTFLPNTKHNFMLRQVSEIPERVNYAFKIATTGRPGPVHIDFPKDIQKEEGDMEIPAEAEGVKSPRREPKEEEVEEAVELLLEADRPLIFAGGGVVLSKAWPELRELAETLQIPVVTSTMAKGVIPEDRPLSLGILGMHGRMSANLAVTECDILLGVGVRFDDRQTGDLRHFAPKADIIHIDIDPVEIGKNIHVEVPIVADAKTALKRMIEYLKSNSLTRSADEWNERTSKLKEKFKPRMDYDETPIKPQRVIKEAMEVLDDDAIITAEVGQCQMWAAHFYDMKKPRKFINSGGLGTMGFGFPAAIGAKVGRPDCQVVDIAGDGSFLMNSQELATAVENDIPVIVLIFNNRYLGMVKQWQDLFYDKRRSATDLGQSPDFPELAESYGAYGARVTRPGEIAPKLQEALDSGKPAVLDVAIDPDEHVLPMVPSGGRLDEMLT
ncbi:acetolactate synthase catalytic subunit [candidate division MSBL1 archaeon SCGC-AAA259E17]|uniref:Acetolactate synthase n=1 Tax=candidate division MSBL1 archaeon SCGC-AAA259E17 TaxID=1698263 RepID=A0A133UF82_9EURY|nr:acetolactate synthase catalytic subunit [candidate division MSBL1 archaeon SCGC-AAA259E17]